MKVFSLSSFVFKDLTSSDANVKPVFSWLDGLARVCSAIHAHPRSALGTLRSINGGRLAGVINEAFPFGLFCPVEMQHNHLELFGNEKIEAANVVCERLSPIAEEICLRLKAVIFQDPF